MGLTSGDVRSRGLSWPALVITGYRNEFTRGLLAATCLLIAVAILVLLASVVIPPVLDRYQ
jgi:hypothetical protein